MNLNDTLNNELIDALIRAALRDANSKGKLSVVATVTGIFGGESELRKIMDSEDELNIMDRGILAMHLIRSKS